VEPADVNWTIGVSGTLDEVMAFAMNERAAYVQKDPPNTHLCHSKASIPHVRFRKSGDQAPAGFPQDLVSPNRESASGRRKRLAY